MSYQPKYYISCPMKRNFTLLTLCTLFTLCKAQPFVNVVQLGYSHQPGYTLVDHPDEFNFTELNLEINLPIVLKNQDVVLFNLGARQVDLDGTDTESFPASRVMPRDPYQTLTGRIGYRKALVGGNSMTLLFQYRRSGSLSDGVSEASQPGGVFLYEQRKSEKLSMRYGAYYSREFFGPLLVPIVGFDWKISDRWYAYANLPITGTLDYRVSNSFHAGFTYIGLVSSFQLPDTGVKSYIHTASTDLTLYGDLYLTPTIVLQGKFGRSMGRFFRQYESDDTIGLMLSALRLRDKREQLNPEIGDGWIAEIKFIFRVKK